MSVSNEIIKVLDALAEKFGLAVDWSSKNIIPYLEKLCGKFINYEVATSIIWLVLGVIMVVLGFIFLKRPRIYYIRSKDREKYDCCQREDYEALCFIFTILIIVLLVVGTYIIFCQTFDIITCYTIPEKILIEEIIEIYDTIK